MYRDCVWHFESKKRLREVSVLRQGGAFETTVLFICLSPFQRSNRVALLDKIQYEYFAIWDHPNSELLISYNHY
jgi:hypothetical protein